VWKLCVLVDRSSSYCNAPVVDVISSNRKGTELLEVTGMDI
jgi:hypothetical protein